MTYTPKRKFHPLKTVEHPLPPDLGRIDYDKVIAHLELKAESSDYWTLFAISPNTSPAKMLRRRRALVNFVNDIQTYVERMRPDANGEPAGYRIWARIEPRPGISAEKQAAEKPLEKIEQKKGW